jgi:hypothetical protein
LAFVWKEGGMHNRTVDDLDEKRTNNLPIIRLDYYAYSKKSGKGINWNLNRQLIAYKNCIHSEWKVIFFMHFNLTHSIQEFSQVPNLGSEAFLVPSGNISRYTIEQIF